MDLATILDDCLQQLQNGESVADCLARYPEQAPRLAPMLAAAVQLQSLAKFSLSDSQRLRGKVALREVLAEPAKGSTWLDWRWLRSWMRGGVLAGALVVLLLILTTATVVATSEPGSLGYPLRIAVERAAVLLETTEIGRAEKELRVANRRLAELEEQLRGGEALEIATLRALLAGDDAAARHAQGLPQQQRLQVANQLIAHAAVVNRLAAGLAGEMPTAFRLQQVAQWTQMLAQRLQAGQSLPAHPPNLAPGHPGPAGRAPILGTPTPTASSSPTKGVRESSPEGTVTGPMGTPAPQITLLPTVSTRTPTRRPIQRPRATATPMLAPNSRTPAAQGPSRTPQLGLSATPDVSATPWPRPTDIPTRRQPSRTPGGPDSTPTQQPTAPPGTREAPTRPRPSPTPNAAGTTPVRPPNTPGAQPTNTPRGDGSATATPEPSGNPGGNPTPGSPGHR